MLHGVRPLRRAAGGLLLAGLVVWGVASVGVGACWARSEIQPTESEVALQDASRDVQSTYRLVHSGGPFPYSKDGSIFKNRERLLPRRPSGHYREYTVASPGQSGRGGKRIVCGGAEPTAPEVCYYTGDHYASFQRIKP